MSSAPWMERFSGSPRRNANADFYHGEHRAHRGAFASSFFLHPSYFLKMTLGRTTSGAIKIKTNGDAGLRAVSCGCCEPMIVFYSYDSDPTLGKGWEDCPNAGRCGGADPEQTSCGGAVISGFVYSEEWSLIPAGRTPKAKIYAGACIDNWGSIGSAFAGEPGNDECGTAYTSQDVIDTAEIEGKRMKIPFHITNAPHGGPYGICGAMIEWYWE